MSAWTGPYKPSAALRLFCFPYAGGTASTYRAWPRFADPGIEIIPVLLPGREARISERPFRRTGALVDAVFNGLRPHLQPPFAFFGHSMGSLLAFELAQRSRETGSAQPCCLFVSGRPAPEVDCLTEPWHELPDREFLARLAQNNPSLNEVIEHPELAQILLPCLRGDYELCATYRHRERPPLECPIMAFAGACDSMVTEASLLAWERHTVSTFQHRMFPGGHFFLHDCREDLVRTVMDRLAGVASVSSA